MNTTLTTIEQNGTDTALAPLTARDIRAQVNLIQEVMREVMQGPTRENPAGVHFGLVPGCGDKPTLLQPGAHKLMMTFRLVPDPDMTIIAMQGGHREVRCKVKLFTQRGVFLGAGVGTCSTLEGKYRYRTGPVEFTDKPVPREYWDLRSSNPAKAKAMLGEGMIPKKNDAGAWVCARQGEKVEHDNPADYYNTVEKMAYKRALVSATLTVTAASDIFTQDIEDMPEVIAGAAVPSAQTAPPVSPSPAPSADKAMSVLNKMKPADHGKGDGGAASGPPPGTSPQQGSDAPSPQQLAERMEMAESVAELSGVMNTATTTAMSAEDRATLKTVFDTHLARLKPGKK